MIFLRVRRQKSRRNMTVHQMPARPGRERHYGGKAMAGASGQAGRSEA